MKNNACKHHFSFCLKLGQRGGILIREFWTHDFGWLVGCFGFNGPLRQYFSLYRAVSQREGERKE